MNDFTVKGFNPVQHTFVFKLDDTDEPRAELMIHRDGEIRIVVRLRRGAGYVLGGELSSEDRGRLAEVLCSTAPLVHAPKRVFAEDDRLPNPCVLCGGPGPIPTPDEVLYATRGHYTWANSCKWCTAEVPVSKRPQDPEALMRGPQPDPYKTRWKERL